jgi:outer membrane lipoprotein-sorting protein
VDKATVTGGPGQTASGTHAYELWLDKGSGLPLRVKAFNAQGAVTEDVIMDDLEIDPVFPEGFFTID